MATLMAGAHIESIEALQAFKAALWKFAESARAALVEAEAQLDRAEQSLKVERRAYWQLQIRKRQEATIRAREALRAKLSLRNMDGTKPSAVEEQKAMAMAQRRLEQANSKQELVRRHGLLLEKQAQLYKGRVQRFASDVQVGIPEASAFLDQAIARIEAYSDVENAEGPGPVPPSLDANPGEGSP